MTIAPQARLNIGCGRRPVSGAVNLDVSEGLGADVVHDLNCLPWPFADDTFDEVHAYEHRWAWMFPAWFISIRLEVIKHAR